MRHLCIGIDLAYHVTSHVLCIGIDLAGFSCIADTRYKYLDQRYQAAYLHFMNAYEF